MLTQRVVINFLSWEEQQQVILSVWSTLKPGGLYLMIENTFEGFENLNSVRRAVGLPNIPLHWHNYFLHYDLLMEFLKGKFVVENVHTFDLYYLLTRVFVNMFAKFEGYGANAKFDQIFKVSDPAARALFDAVGERISIRHSAGNSFGPIQAFVLRKIS